MYLCAKENRIIEKDMLMYYLSLICFSNINNDHSLLIFQTRYKVMGLTGFDRAEMVGKHAVGR